MRIVFRANETMLGEIRNDLRRPHQFAQERVGFLIVRAAQGLDNLMLLAKSYHPVRDEEYIRDRTVGAMIGSEAIRRALEMALVDAVGVFHIHMHYHAGDTRFSAIDLREQPKFVPDFFKVRPEMPHGAIVLSDDRVRGRAWLSPTQIVEIAEYNIVGKTIEIRS